MFAVCVCFGSGHLWETFSPKVTFQTPLWDPHTRRIPSSDIKKKPETPLIVDDCTEASGELAFNIV